LPPASEPQSTIKSFSAKFSTEIIPVLVTSALSSHMPDSL
jgi:hypothetical protein